MKTSTLLATLILTVVAIGQTVKAPDNPAKAASSAPVINSATLWRLVAEAQQARFQANQTPQAKAAEAAEDAVRKEQERLSSLCGTGYYLGVDGDEKSPTHKDVVCLKRPDPPPAPKPEGKK